MPKYVAFLRAINVGGRTVTMDRLCDMFASLKYSNVESYIASGNILFDSRSKRTSAFERQIADHLHNSLGYEVATFVRTLPELAEIAEYKPFPDADLNGEGNLLYVGFVEERPADASIQALSSCRTAVDEFYVEGRQVYWLCRKGLGKSEFSLTQLEKTLKVPATLRNATTVRKLAALYC